MEKGIMKMRHVGKVSVPAGEIAILKPGSFHIMFMGLYNPINKGDELPLTLIFKKSGTLKIIVKAQKLMGKGAMDHSKMEKAE
jgi:copper(I)-binding protein